MKNIIICAWCNTILKDGVMPPSHTICPACLHREKAKIQCSSSMHNLRRPVVPLARALSGEGSPETSTGYKPVK
jgi:hypothetical protein